VGDYSNSRNSSNSFTSHANPRHCLNLQLRTPATEI
jgi:hypothetical protein